MATRPESVRLTARERRQLHGIERGLRGASGLGGTVVRLGLDAAALALVTAGIFVDLSWLFAGCVAANFAACLHLDRRPGGPKCSK
ncbi:hypothetical protein VA596_46780 [Amycolatopsis sp., V23-08]|uniref:DUF2892 domain-containing protein n=1 Tax=Amycolatopsis heterodermiae TaxID=3110235 RepID=A0ABU5RLF9_9PSEU|nr:hypothetical protein [Amycolatopsis sp., V23-08]MEA5367107.1 hypothetical protein [Amycolatopsis sp., V23-08]